MSHQIHFGKKFYLDTKKGYWISTTCPRIRAHVFVWKYHNGEVPKGFHVHHLNENKSDNRIENLQLMSKSEHISLHMSTDQKKSQSTEQANKVRHLTKEWHASAEGLEWHRIHGIKTWQERKSFSGTCKVCSKQFETKTFHQNFCSNACKSMWRRSQKIDYIEKKCPVCNKEYFTNKYSRSKTCGRKCGNLLKG